jgi:membrane associated rhomboid family serine protease
MNNTEKQKILSAIMIPVVISIILWIIYFFDSKYQLNLYKYGVFPAKTESLIGIVLHPFIHDSKNVLHILNNTPPFFVLSTCLFYFYREIAVKTIVLIWLISGFWLWIAAEKAYHIGISGIIYGLAFFLFFSGVLRKDNKLMAITLLVSFLYGSMIWGIFPYDEKVSWQGHLYGSIIGIVLAYAFRKQGPQRQIYQYELEEENEIYEEEYWKVDEDNYVQERKMI